MRASALPFALLPIVAACRGSAAPVTEPPTLSCTSTEVTGRLTRTPGGRGFTFATATGWTIAIDSSTMRIAPPGAQAAYLFWSSTRESLSGKHIKDVLQPRRTLELDGGTLITIAADSVPAQTVPDGMQFVRWISIYDGNESHRISFTAGRPSVTRSCALARFGESDEYDGEAGRLTETNGGLRFENTYTQGAAAAGTPLPKQPALVPLGQTNYGTPTLVNDFFDDPRFGHT